MSAKLFEPTLGIVDPWFIQGVHFDAAKKTLTIRVDFIAGSRFGVPGMEGAHPAHDTVTKRYRHLNFFQHECYLEVRMPRVRLPDGGIRLVEPGWAGKLAGFTLLFEALIITLCRENALCGRGPIGQSVLASGGRHLRSFPRAGALGSGLLTLFADADERRVLLVDEGRRADTVTAMASDLVAHGGDPDAIESISIDMSPAFIQGVGEPLPNAHLTFDKFHVVAHASAAVDKMRRIEQKRDPSLKGLRWSLLKDREKLNPNAQADLNALLAQVTTKRTARA